MMIHIPEVLTKDQVGRLRTLIDAADWIDGNATSGAQSALAKRNEQLPEDSAAARTAGEAILDSYESERRPVITQNIDYALFAFQNQFAFEAAI